MNYLTNYYKNLCEQLQAKINLLESELALIEGKKPREGTEAHRVDKIKAKDKKKKIQQEKEKDAQDDSLEEELQAKNVYLKNLLETHPSTRADRRREDKKAKKHPHAKFKGDGGRRREQEKVEGKPAKRGERVGEDEY